MQQFKNVTTVGGGAFSEVFKATNDTTGNVVAIKKIEIGNAEDGIPQRVLREISLLRDIKHPNIIPLLSVKMENTCMLLVFEYIPLDLYKYMCLIEPNTVMDPEIMRSFLYQITQGLFYCHARRILHRDLKPCNILITEKGEIKIADLGMGRQICVPSRTYSPTVVTLWYRAPEILLGASTYSCGVDIWSLGCTFAEMVNNKALFTGETEIDQWQAICSILSKPTENIWPGVTKFPYSSVLSNLGDRFKTKQLREHVRSLDDTGFNLLEQMLIYYPIQRISAKAILKHPYFAGYQLKLFNIVSS